MKPREFIATILAVAAVVGSVAVPFWYQQQKAIAANERTITLTGIATSGIWTTDDTTGENYHKGNFKPAQIHLNKGESVRLILRSADVIHRFYMPELGIGPVDLVPGHTEEVHFKADKEGVFNYYCTEICGDCHFHMRGVMTVGGTMASNPTPIPDVTCDETKHANPPVFADILQEGRYWFETKGCVSCHGIDGQGGVANFNYARGTVPALNTLGTKMFLQSKDEVDVMVKTFQNKTEINKDKPINGISNWPLVSAQYGAVTKTILGGSPPLKADPQGPAPPLFMPSWKEKLDKDQMNSIIAYLLSQQKFVEQTGWGN